MKRNIIYALTAFFAAHFFWSCDDAKNPVLENSIYLAEAADRDEYGSLIKPMREATYNVNVKMTHKLDHDVTVKLKVDETLLAKHFEEFGENIAILPSGNWMLHNADGTPVSGNEISVTFSANQTSEVVPIKITPVEGGEESQYALPITITSVSEDIHVLENLSSQLFVFQAPFETYALTQAKTSQIIKQIADNTIALHDWTLEFHFCLYRGGRASNGTYGCPLFFSGATGGEGIYVRQYPTGGMDIHMFGTFGTGSYSMNSGNAAKYPDDYYYNTAYQGVWDHFALVCQNGTMTSYLNGQKMGETTSAQFDVDWEMTSIMIADGNMEYAPQGYSEMRLWNYARTLPQLTRFKFDVDPKSEGLMFYYKMNEPDVMVLEDLTGNGYDIELVEAENTVKQNNTRFISWVKVKTNDDYTSFVTVE